MTVLVHSSYRQQLCIYDTIGEFNVDWKAEYSALSSTRSQKKKLKQPTPGTQTLSMTSKSDFSIKIIIKIKILLKLDISFV